MQISTLKLTREVGAGGLTQNETEIKQEAKEWIHAFFVLKEGGEGNMQI